MRTGDSNRDTRDVTRGALANLAGLLLRGLGIVFLLSLGRLYGAEVTGLFLLTFAFVDSIFNLAALGLDRAVLRLVAERHIRGDLDGVRQTVAEAATVGLISSVPIAALVALLAPTIASRVFAKPELSDAIRIMSLAIPVWTLSTVILFSTRAMRVMRYQLITKNVVEPGVKVILAISIHTLGLGLPALAGAVPASALVGLATAAFFFSRELPGPGLLRARPRADGCRAIARFAAPIGLNAFLTQLHRRVDIFLVGRILSPALLGIYAAALEGATVVKGIRLSMDPILIPVLAGARHQSDGSGMLAQYRNVTRWMLLLSGAVLGVYAVAGRTVMGIFGPEFSSGSTALLLVTAATAVWATLGISELFLLIDRPILNVLNTLAALVAQVALVLTLVPRYGLVGAALATFITFTLINVVQVIQVRLRYGVQPITLYHARGAAAALLSLAGVTGVRQAVGGDGLGPDLLSAIGFLALYAILLIRFGLADPERSIVPGAPVRA